MNYLLITIDALSKWYIDQTKSLNSFFSYMEQHTYNFSNMYSLGPFTEAAVRGYWSGDLPLQGYSYLSESHFESDTFFDVFSQTHYMYYGSLVPYFNYDVKVDNHIQREKCENRAFEHIWSARLTHYCNLYRENRWKSNDYFKVEFILDNFFRKYGKAKKVWGEKNKYEQDKEKYIFDILRNQEQSSMYKALCNELIDNCKYRNIACIRNQYNHEVSPDEAIFIKKAKNKNVMLALANESNTLDKLESILNGEKNRCIISNNDLLAQMRDENEKLPKLKEEIDDFLCWYDEKIDEIKQPFFAYIHNYDFHFPENFMNARYEDSEEYNRELRRLINEIDDFNNNKISISKQLCLKLIEQNLCYLWKELDKRKIFENTCVIITADHGISNFMNPISRSNSRWNFTRTNFNIPFYVKAPNVVNKIDSRYLSTKLVKRYLQEIDTTKKITVLGNNVQNDTYVCTSWINGIPEVDRSLIKIGIRSDKWSITCEGSILQTFQSLRILGIYDLQNDPDEINHVEYSKASYSGDFKELFQKMGCEWYRQMLDLLSRESIEKLYPNMDGYNEILRENKDYCSNCERITKEDFYKKIKGKRIIVYGNNQYAADFLKYLSIECKLEEIWTDSTVEDNYFYGHKVFEPHMVNSEYILVNCSLNDLKFLQIVKDCMAQNTENYLRII